MFADKKTSAVLFESGESVHEWRVADAITSRTASRDVSDRVWLENELKGANETTRIVHASRKFQKLLGWLCFRGKNVNFS